MLKPFGKEEDTDSDRENKQWGDYSLYLAHLTDLIKLIFILIRVE